MSDYHLRFLPAQLDAVRASVVKVGAAQQLGGAFVARPGYGYRELGPINKLNPVTKQPDPVKDPGGTPYLHINVRTPAPVRPGTPDADAFLALTSVPVTPSEVWL